MRGRSGNGRYRFAVTALVIGAAILGACGSEDDSDPGVAPSPGPAGTASVRPGTPVLPPPDADALDGLAPVEVVDPQTAAVDADEMGEYSNGWMALYADASAEDPFAGAWVLAVLHQGSENSGIGRDGVDPGETGTTWTELPVEQLSQEARVAGLLSHGLDAEVIDRLVADAEVSGGDGGDGRIALSGDGLTMTRSSLEQVADGPLDVAQLSAGFQAPAPAPSVRWASSPTWTDDLRSVTVSSYTGDRALDLLLRASAGGASAGAVLIPGLVPGDVAQLGVRSVEESTALVQTVGVDPPVLEAVLDSLGPVADGRWSELEEQVLSTPPAPSSANPAAVTSGRIPGGAYTADVEVGSMQGIGGEYPTCMRSLTITYADGSFGGGGMDGGTCSEFGSIQATTLQGGGVLIVGDLPPTATSVQLEFDGGEVVEPEVVGSTWKLFSVVLDTPSLPTSGRVFDAAGSTVAVLAPDDGMAAGGLAGGPGSSSGRSFVAAG